MAGSATQFEIFESNYPWVNARRLEPDGTNARGLCDVKFRLTPDWEDFPSAGELFAMLRGIGDEWKPTQHAMSCNVMKFRANERPWKIHGSRRVQIGPMDPTRILCSCGLKP